MEQRTIPTAGELIKRYIELRDTLSTLNDEHAGKIKPYQDGMELIEGLLMDEINRLDGQSIKTMHGTAYRSMTTSFRVADRNAWIDWVIANKQTEMLTTNVAKEAIKEYIDQTKQTPPGLTITQIYKTNIRRSDNG